MVSLFMLVTLVALSRKIPPFSVGFRNTPESILYMLERLIEEDFKEQKDV